jgi:hypothetical protein
VYVTCAPERSIVIAADGHATDVPAPAVQVVAGGFPAWNDAAREQGEAASPPGVLRSRLLNCVFRI